MAKHARKYFKGLKDAQHRFNSEKLRVERQFPCFSCVLRRNFLTCTGSIIPSFDCCEYKIRINYRFGRSPKVSILSPHIVPRHEIHMFSSGHLCLFDSRVSPWSSKMLVHETIIPWTAEWLIYYELWKVVGEWLGPEAPHLSASKNEEK